MSQSIGGSTSGGPLFSSNAQNPQRIRNVYKRFRILIIGRANAGKTTILQKVCNTAENPVVYNAKGEKIDLSVLEASASRGLHNIDDEMIFKSNPRFVFHDSRGFEAGGEEELNKVKSFIEGRSNETMLNKKLHAIWYCIPVDDSRPFTTAENWFFSECGTGDVPVVAIFTKFDALDVKAFTTLRKEKGKSRAEAKRLAPQHAITSFEGVHIKTLSTLRYPPKRHVYLRNMNKEGPDCSDLVEQTALALDDEVLQQLFVSTQRNNLKLCIRYGLERSSFERIQQGLGKLVTISREKEIKEMIHYTLSWFPQFFDPSRWQDLSRYDLSRYYSYLDIQPTVDLFYSRLFSKLRMFTSVQVTSQLAITTAILADFGFLLWEDRRLDFSKVIDLYEQHPSIRDAISTAVNKTLQTFNRGPMDDGAKQQLMKQMVQIALDNRMPTELLRDPIVAR